MPDLDTVSRRTRAAVEKAARALCCGDECGCDAYPTEKCFAWNTRRSDAIACLLAYLRAQGRDLEADQVERIRDE